MVIKQTKKQTKKVHLYDFQKKFITNISQKNLIITIIIK